jgi:dinuclear metal center YbgI/SA1388 family protein
MKLRDITSFLESIAPASLQESYDNAGLITGEPDRECRGIITTLDSTVEVIDEAIEKGCNLVVAHHPIVFGGLKKINGKNYVERAIIKAIRNEIAIYAIHTNLDNVMAGVNGKMAQKLGLGETRVLSPRKGMLRKLYTFVPYAQVEEVRNALFAAGAGHIGNYSECSFGTEGVGTFKGLEGTNPFAGKPGERHHEKEWKIELVFPSHLEQPILDALIQAHPYEEVAYDVVVLENTHESIGSGLIGELSAPVSGKEFLEQVKAAFGLKLIRHTSLPAQEIKKVALCGGAGSFLISKALSAGADAYISSDIKYHEFFDADGRLMICDIGHYESEQFTTDLLYDILRQKFPNFAVLKTEVKTNPVHYFV